MEEIKVKLMSQQARIPISEAFIFLLPEEPLKLKNIYKNNFEKYIN